MYRLPLMLLLLACLHGPGWIATAVAGPVPDSASRLPAKTLGYVSIIQPAAFRAKWQSTRLGGIFQHPAMKDFSSELNKLLEARRNAMHRVYGVDLKELIDIADRELALAMVETESGDITLVFLADAGDQQGRAQQLLDRAVKRLSGNGGKQTNHTVDGATLLQFQTPQEKAVDEDLALFARDNILVLGGDTPTVKQILESWQDPQKDKLATKPAFLQVLGRVDGQNGDWAPPVTLYFDPIRLAVVREVPRVLPDGSLRPAFPVRHGFDCIRAIGGRLDVAEKDCDVFYSIAIFLDGPRERGMNLLELVEGDNFEIPTWMPDYLSSLAILHWRIDKIIDHIGPLFDDIAANDVDGTFDEIVEETRTELGVDLKEMFDSLGPRVLVTSDLLPDVSTTSQRDLIAIEIQPGREEVVEVALAGMFGDDPTAEAIRLPVPSRQGERIVTANGVLWRVGDAGGRPGGGERSFTAAGMMVANGHLLIATNYEMLRRLFQPASQLAEPRLSAAEDLKRIFQALELPNRAALIFGRVHRDFFTTYHLLRAGQLTQAETFYGRAISMVMEQLQADQNERAPEIDFSRLPEFHEIEACFGNNGMCLQNGADGWLITGFLKPRTSTSDAPQEAGN